MISVVRAEGRGSTRGTALVASRWLMLPLVALGFLSPVGTGDLFAQEPPVEAPSSVDDVVSAPNFGGEGDGARGTSRLLTRDALGHTTIRAVRIDTPIQIDGRLDEPFYRNTPPITEFVQSVPTEDGEPTELTEVWIGFDDTHLYVAARVWDSQGEEGWISNEMRRDSNQLRQNDNFGIFLDTYLDRRNALAFYVTPIGGFADFQITNEGSPNFDWNPVWDVRTGRFDGGWTAEMAIPFKSLRYRPGRDQVWGIQMRRSVLRRGEWNHINPLPLAAVGNGSQGVFRVSMYGTLVGVETPPLGRNLEVKPYATSGLRTDLSIDPRVSNDLYGDIGVDVKYAITQNLTADFTVNTDFAQVEVDEQQVNLTRFSLVFPEKRDFFLEGRGIFNFGAGAVGFGGPGGGGGGAAPTLFYSRRIGLQGGNPVPILGGARVTGKVGSFDVGALSIQTADDAKVQHESTNFTVLRLSRDLFARSSVGVLFQNRSRSIVAEGGSNQAWGIDGSFGLTPDLSVLSYYAQSSTPGMESREASYRAQVTYDADRYGASLDHLMVGDGFNPEIGFVRRRDFRQTSASARFSPRPASIQWIRQMTFQANLGYLENERTGYLESRDWRARFQTDFEHGDAFTASLTDRYENLVVPERLSGALIPAGRYTFSEYQINYRMGPQRRYQGNASLQWGGYFTGDRLSLGVGQGRLEVTPQLSIEPSLEFNWIDLPQQEFSGQFDQHVARTRVTYTLTPRAYVSGLAQYNTGSESFSGNFRLRWEWAPGSELFIVYTEDRNTAALDRWSELSNRGLVVKVTRLFQL
jgi:hypothetical protein